MNPSRRTTMIGLLAAACVASSTAGDTITLRRSVRLAGDGNVIRLCDIAILDGEYAESIGELEVGSINPDQVQPLEIHVAEVRRLLNEQQIHWGRINLNGQTSIVRPRRTGQVELPLAMHSIDLAARSVPTKQPRRELDEARADTLLGLDTFRGWLARSLITELKVEPGNLELLFQRSQAGVLDQPLSTGRFEIRAMNVSSRSERLDYEVRQWKNGQPVSRSVVSIEPRIRTVVARLRIDIPRGQTILAEHVETVEQWMTPLQRTGRVAPSSISGRAAAERLRADSILRERDLKQAVAIRRGDDVRISCIVGGGVLSLRAVAEEDGSIGDIVRLRKGRERDTFTARITGRGEAVLDLAEARPASLVDAGAGVHP